MSDTKGYRWERLEKPPHVLVEVRCAEQDRRKRGRPCGALAGWVERPATPGTAVSLTVYEPIDLDAVEWSTGRTYRELRNSPPPRGLTFLNSRSLVWRGGRFPMKIRQMHFDGELPPMLRDLERTGVPFERVPETLVISCENGWHRQLLLNRSGLLEAVARAQEEDRKVVVAATVSHAAPSRRANVNGQN